MWLGINDQKMYIGCGVDRGGGSDGESFLLLITILLRLLSGSNSSWIILNRCSERGEETNREEEGETREEKKQKNWKQNRIEEQKGRL